MICPAQEILKRLLNNPTEHDILQAEIFVRLECPEHKACRRALDHELIKRGQLKRDQADPVTQETDKKSSANKNFPPPKRRSS